MRIEVENLLTIKNYASNNNVTPSYIYKMIKENKMEAMVIDGVRFIDAKKYPNLPTKK